MSARSHFVNFFVQDDLTRVLTLSPNALVLPGTL